MMTAIKLTCYFFALLATALVPAKAASAQNRSGSLLVVAEDRNSDTIQSLVAELSHDSILILYASTNNGMLRLENLVTGEYNLTITFENGQIFKVDGIQIKPETTTTSHHTLTYPCYFFEQRMCPVNDGKKHKPVPVEEARYYGNQDEYFKRKKGKALYSVIYKSDCFPEEYCKQHKVLY